jgi:hypothetical protein
MKYKEKAIQQDSHGKGPRAEQVESDLQISKSAEVEVVVDFESYGEPPEEV